LWESGREVEGNLMQVWMKLDILPGVYVYLGAVDVAKSRPKGLWFSRTACALLAELGDKQAHMMRFDDVDAQYGGSVNDVWMKGSPQETSLCSIVIVPICPAYAIFQ
jgi:hypothetical protein